ncbi:hypothetical protein, partial [Rhizobium sp. SGZ-381]|uniref:hypothetical protein n=1 Tax=Rhizobium sp. SGZ-381 TaxID=3342800 RepID=UPI00366EC7BF
MSFAFRLGLGIAPAKGVRDSTAWVMRDETGDKAPLDIDHENGRFWYNGAAYATAAALYAALGTVSVVSGNLVTLGPTPQGAELVV